MQRGTASSCRGAASVTDHLPTARRAPCLNSAHWPLLPCPPLLPSSPTSNLLHAELAPSDACRAVLPIAGPLPSPNPLPRREGSSRRGILCQLLGANRVLAPARGFVRDARSRHEGARALIRICRLAPDKGAIYPFIPHRVHSLRGPGFERSRRTRFGLGLPWLACPIFSPPRRMGHPPAR